MKPIAQYLLMAITGAALWAWVVIDAQVPLLQVVALVIAEALAFTAGRPLEKWLRSRKERT